ncbi:hypothetical protein [Actinopolymorpha alba]|uniref:hypothetical protein n=1 Tax=Actinopolymorpha alba TaxID=533267 RepID=UPI000370AAF7|nr:hypothetical protein [Actinopolymorpha alba]
MTTEFVSDPIVPLELRLSTGTRFTLYQPGWYTADDGSSGFLGAHGKVYGFSTLDDLVTFVDSGTPSDLTPSPHMKNLRIWTTEEYSRRLCLYDMTQLPEIADGHLDSDEQAALGSTLALMLDLLDYLDIDNEHAQALRDDEDVSKLASGDEVLSIFRAAHHRQHVVELLDAHWSSCLSEVSSRLITPTLPDDPPNGSGASGPAGPGTSPMASSTSIDDSDSDGPTPLEDTADAVTIWLGLAEEGVYTIRSTALTDGRPAYLGTANGDGGAPKVSVWTDLDQLRSDLTAGQAGRIPDVELAGVAARSDVSLTPHDDCIFDLVEIADSITATMDQASADQLVSAWTELTRLAAWGRWTDVTDLLKPTAPAGAFVVSCAIDLAQDRPGAARALATADLTAASEGWHAVVPALTAHLDIHHHER